MWAILDWPVTILPFSYLQNPGYVCDIMCSALKKKKKTLHFPVTFVWSCASDLPNKIQVKVHGWGFCRSPGSWMESKVVPQEMPVLLE